MKILISDKSSPRCAEILRKAGHEVEEITGLSPEKLTSIIGTYDGMIVRSATTVTADLIEAAKKLKVIGRAGSGVDNIDVKAATARDIVVMNTPGGNSNAVAEMSLTHMLALSKQLQPAVVSMKERRWDKKLFKGSEIKGKTLGILGYGRVSRLLAEKCLGLGMEVVCFDPKIQKNIIDDSCVQIVASLEKVLSRADYLSVHLTRRAETLNFLSKPQFEEVRKGAYLINCSRGGIVNEKDLLWALNEEILAGAALDVYESEPPADFALIEHPKVICTPHIAASTREAQENVAVMIAEQFVDMFAGKEVRNRVNG